MSKEVKEAASVYSLIAGLPAAAERYGVTSQTICRWRADVAPEIRDWKAARRTVLTMIAADLENTKRTKEFLLAMGGYVAG